MISQTELLKSIAEKEEQGLCSLLNCDDRAVYKSKISNGLYCEHDYQRFLAKGYSPDKFTRLADEKAQDWDSCSR